MLEVFAIAAGCVGAWAASRFGGALQAMHVPHPHVHQRRH